jgi:hypothetical protein
MSTTTTDNKKAGEALFRQITKAAQMAESIETLAGRDAASALAEVMREFTLARMGGFNEENE